jgi:transcriptional regulator with XRE-family HTH domain
VTTGAADRLGDSDGRADDGRTNAEIGQRIKSVRRAQQMTLATLAENSGLTKGFVSKIERGVASPSVAALIRLSEALSLPLASLFENSATRHLIRRGECPQVFFGGSGITEYLLTPVAERRLQVILSEIASGGGSGEELYSLSGEVEFVHVLRGECVVSFSDGAMTLTAGDSLTFDPSQFRSFSVPESAPDTTVIWTLTPALPNHPIRR